MARKMSLQQRLEAIKLLVLDVDGVLTDGRLYVSPQGEELKCFNILDGHGIKLLQATGVQVAIISGRDSEALRLRAQALGIQHLYCGREDKHLALQELWQQTGFNGKQTAVIGDDWPDLLAMRDAVLAATVPNASRAVLEYAHWCSEKPGGEGAVRELCELIMQAQGSYADSLAVYLGQSQPAAEH